MCPAPAAPNAPVTPLQRGLRPRPNSGPLRPAPLRSPSQLCSPHTTLTVTWLMTSPAANRRSELRAARQARVCPPAPRGLRRTSTPDLRRFRCRPPAALQASPGRRDGHPPPAQERLPPGALAAAVPEDTGAAPGPAGQPGSLRLSVSGGGALRSRSVHGGQARGWFCAARSSRVLSIRVGGPGEPDGGGRHAVHRGPEPGGSGEGTQSFFPPPEPGTSASPRAAVPPGCPGPHGRRWEPVPPETSLAVWPSPSCCSPTESPVAPGSGPWAPRPYQHLYT